MGLAKLKINALPLSDMFICNHSTSCECMHAAQSQQQQRNETGAAMPLPTKHNEIGAAMPLPHGLTYSITKHVPVISVWLN